MTFAQDIIVTMAMCGALGLVLRRVVGFARARTGAPKCASCASGACAPVPVLPASSVPASTLPLANPDQPVSRPLVFIRSSR